MDNQAEQARISDAVARRRFMVINAVRLAGIAMILIGIAALSDKIALPDVAAYILIVVGMAEAFLLPTMLARKWSTRRQ